METVTVDAAALYSVLAALNGPGHLIRELQAIRGLHALTGDSPIDVLVDQYSAAMEKDRRTEQGDPNA